MPSTYAKAICTINFEGIIFKFTCNRKIITRNYVKMRILRHFCLERCPIVLCNANSEPLPSRFSCEGGIDILAFRDCLVGGIAENCTIARDEAEAK